MGHRPFHEIRDDKEVTRKAHGLDDADLAFQALPVGRFSVWRRRGCQPPAQTFPGLFRQFLVLSAAARGWEAWQDRLTFVDHEGAASRDFEGVFTGLRQIGEQGAHVRSRFEPVLRADAPPLFLAHERAIGDAKQGVMRLPGVRLGEIDVIGGHQGGVVVVSPSHQPRLGGRFDGQAVPLQLNIETIGERPLHFSQRRCSLRASPSGEQRINRPVRSSGEQDEAIAVGHNLCPGYVRRLDPVDLEKCGRREFAQIPVPGLVLDQKHDCRRKRPALGRTFADTAHGQTAADNRLHAVILGDHGKFQGPKQIGPVGQGDSGHRLGRREFSYGVRLYRPLEEGIGRPDAQMDKGLPVCAHLLLLNATVADSGDELGHLAHHPNEACDRRKRERVHDEAKHGDQSLSYPFCSALYSRFVLVVKGQPAPFRLDGHYVVNAACGT